MLAYDLNPRQLAAVQAQGFTLRERLSLNSLNLQLLRFAVPEGLGVDAALARLRASDPAGDYDRNSRYRLAAAAPCTGVRCYGQQLVGIKPEASACTASPRIALLDTAVDARHPALQGVALQTRRIGSGAGSPPAHGTAVAALLAGAAQQGFAGLLPRARLFAADVFADADGEAVADTARLVAGLDWALAQAPHAINLSLTGPDSPLLKIAVQRVLARGIPLVAAAGNAGPRAAPLFPAGYADTLAVTAVDRRLKPWSRAAQGSHIALAAPGVAIWSAEAGGEGRFRDGTSFASPFVAAAAALLKSQSPRATPADIAQSLRGSARDLGPAGTDPVFGAGLVQWPACR